MDFFSVDGPLYKFLSTLWDVIKLNFLWLLFSLPIVTIGASTVAAFSVTNKMSEETEGYVGRQFVQAFKENWKQGVPLGLFCLLCAYVLYLDFEIYRVTESMPVLVAGIISAVYFVSAFIYAFPLIARYDNTVLQTLKNSIRITMRYFPRTIALVAVLAFEIVMFLFNTTTLFFLLLIGPVCIIYTISGFAMYVFRQIEKDNESGE
ncbi:MAG: DUF624 domain-containing protein [Lachnospiraceae bacterium]|nr:DUF624 domain-containing protein [Lachnospiraceae bacterium]